MKLVQTKLHQVISAEVSAIKQSLREAGEKANKNIHAENVPTCE